MTDRDVLSISGRMLGIIWLIVFILRISGVASELGLIHDNSFQVTNSRLTAIAVGDQLVLALLLSLLMLAFSDRVARIIIPHPTIVGNDWQRWAFSVSARIIGLVLLLHGIEHLWIATISHYIAVHYTTKHLMHMRWDFITIIPAITNLAISAYLLTGAKHLYLSSPLSALRPQPIPVEEDNEQP